MAKKKTETNGAEKAEPAPGPHHNNPAGARLRSFVQRIENLEEDKAGIAGDIKEVYSEAKGEGFDTKVLRKIIARRRRDAQEVREEEELMELYLAHLGDLPLFEREYDAPGGNDEPTIEDAIAEKDKASVFKSV